MSHLVAYSDFMFQMSVANSSRKYERRKWEEERGERRGEGEEKRRKRRRERRRGESMVKERGQLEVEENRRGEERKL